MTDEQKKIDELKKLLGEQPTPTPLRDAARAGLLLGLFFALKYLCFMYSIEYPLLLLLFAVGTLLVPFFAYSFTKVYRELYFQGKEFKFRVAWVHGTWLYLFSTLIMLLPVYIFYSRVLPDALPILQQSFEQLYAQAPELKAYFVELLGEEPIATIAKSTSSEYMLQNLLACLNRNFIAGALLSLINAAILQRK